MTALPPVLTRNVQILLGLLGFIVAAPLLAPGTARVDEWHIRDVLGGAGTSVG